MMSPTCTAKGIVSVAELAVPVALAPDPVRNAGIDATPTSQLG
jgi:hypothetical protein